ncbi:MAG TPA: tRNA (adenosine(37)-N6)-threonylcarbamoyltransferase complex dimerization subunit type 1 TsaB [Candidatus Polarisedimenticolia bacterium]|jgi:tRNA threonylcarbamoyladenosine biosynthesis protein TsaB
MIALGIDTSTGAGSVGLTDGGALAAELNQRSAGTHSGRLLPSVRALLEATGTRLDQIDLVAVACGPGSFTGLRIGMATAKGLAISLDRPVTGFSTLETIAWSCAASLDLAARAPICVVLEAGRGEVYRGLFACEGGEVTAIEPEAAMTPLSAASGLPRSCLLCGDGVTACRAALPAQDFEGRILMDGIPFIGLALARRALAIEARASSAGLPPLVPNYLRSSDAEIHFKG